MGAHLDLGFVPAISDKDAGETVNAQALFVNVSGDSQQFAIRARFDVAGTPVEYMSGFSTFAAGARRYLSIAFPMPSQSIAVYIDGIWLDQRRFQWTVEETRGPYTVNIPAPTLPPLPPIEGPFTLSPAVRASLMSIPLFGRILVAVAEWLLSAVNSLSHSLSPLWQSLKAVGDLVEVARTGLSDWLNQKEPWFGNRYGQWVAGTIAFLTAERETAESKIWLQFPTIHGALDAAKTTLDWTTDRLLWVNDKIDALAGKVIPVEELQLLVKALWDTLAALPDNWSNFFWFPIDFMLNAIDAWLYAEVDE